MSASAPYGSPAAFPAALKAFGTHPLVAQQWKNRLKDKIVIAANAGFRPAHVHFAARTALDLDLIKFLADRRPPCADENYGGGRRSACGGALRIADWAAFFRSLGFGRDAEVPCLGAAA